MADKRKLQGEIDRCLKKIQEGLEAFDDIWKKVHGTNNTNQKEKFEADLKKEIKKLQRLRDQIKTWVVSADIKDKETLVEHRKKIESKMEQFKVIERETKTKAYSKEGLLGTTGKVDPKEKEKEEITNWLQHNIQELGLQSDGIEGVIEQLTGRRKKLCSEDQVKFEQCKERLVRNKYHISKLEAILRLVDNGASILDQINGIKDQVEYYISSYDKDPDYLEDDELYNDLDLDEVAAMQADLLASSPPECDTDSQHSTQSSTTANLSSESPSPMTTAPPLVIPTHSKSGGNKNSLVLKISSSSSSTTSTTGSKVPPTPTKLTTPNTPSTPSSEVSSTVVRPSLATTAGLGYAQVAGSHHGTVAGKTTTVNSPKLSHTSTTGANGLVSASLVQSYNQSISSTSAVPSNRATAPPSPVPVLPVSVTPALQVASAPGPAMAEQSQQLSALNQQQVQQLIQQQLLIQQQQLRQQSEGRVVNGTVGEGETNLGSETLASLSLKTLAHNAAATAGALDSQSNGDGNSNPASAPTLRPDQGAVSVSSLSDAKPVQLASNGDQQKLLQQQQQQQQLLLQQQALQQQQSSSSGGTQVIHLSPLLGVAPLGPLPVTQEHVFSQKMLESAFMRLPYPCDSERVRLYFPNNPCPTPHWYPQTTPPHLNTFEFFNRLDTDSLFFMFYYMEGTKAQYMAAKALKQKSWRFHTKYMMWFQRHEEPKTITEEFEQGTYIYFDYEKWGQRKKEGFRFEYKYLEDQELA